MIQRILLVVAILLATQAHLLAKNIVGKVQTLKQPIADVVVTDGRKFTKTNQAGEFSLNTDDAEFVYIFTPSGFSAPFDSGAPVFYQPLSEVDDSLIFELQKLPYSTEDYALLAIADPQTKTLEHMERFENESIQDLKGTISECKAKKLNVVGITLGDIVHDNLPLFDNYKAAIAKLNIPVYPVIGNHDYDQNITEDYASTAEYRKQFGPTDYGFNLGQRYYIVLDDIIYNGRKNYTTGLTQRQLTWVRNYLEYIPKGAELVIALHAPFKNIHLDKNIELGSELLEICKDYQLSFISGHTHLNNNTEVAEGVFEYNIGAMCGAWWKAKTCQDGTPNGYKVFESVNNTYASYYKSTGKDRYYQMELYNRGMLPEQANAVVAKIWNWDSTWKVEWYADAVYMGNLKQFTANDPYFVRFRKEQLEAGNRASKSMKAVFFFAAHPAKNTKLIKVVATDGFGNRYEEELKLKDVDVEAHRGGAGLMPENTIEAMLNAVQMGVNTLELDVQTTKDGLVIVAHDPKINIAHTYNAKGDEISDKTIDKLVFSRMKYKDIAKFDNGSKPYDRFPNQKKIKTQIPLLSALIDSVECFTLKNGYSPICYNIEIKSSKEKEEKNLVLDYKAYTDLTMDILLQKELGERLLVQSFDTRCLNYLHENYPDVNLALLVGNEDGFEKNMAKLNFIPAVYSPNYKLVDDALIQACKTQFIKLVPWTVDEVTDIQKMLELGVNGIISNYPNRVLKQTRGYGLTEKQKNKAL